MDAPSAQGTSDARPQDLTDGGHPAAAAERAMWEALLRRDVENFRASVSPDAVMVCGGLRGTGEEYAGYLPVFDISSYTITDLITRAIGPEAVLLCYELRTECRRADSDLAGTFQVSSLRMRRGDGWILVFNQDSRVGPSHLGAAG